MLLNKPLRPGADGFVIPERPIPSPLLTPRNTNRHHRSPLTPQCVDKAQDDKHSAIAEEVIQSEIASLLDGFATWIMEELREADRQVGEECATSTISDGLDKLGDVDDDFEVQNTLLTPEQCDPKEKIWEELNKDYLREQELNFLKKETDLRNSITKTAKKCKGNKSRDSNCKEMVATSAGSPKNMLMRRSYFKKINYKVIEVLFKDD